MPILEIPKKTKLQSFLLAIFILLPLVIPVYYVNASTLECESLAVIVYDDGGAWIYENVTVVNAPANITISLLAPPLTLYAEDQEGVPLPVSYTNKSATITVYGSGTVTVRYYTLALTSKTGYFWKLSLTSPCPLIVVLPEDAVPVRMEPTPTPTLYKGQAALRFPASSITIEYYIIPGRVSPTSTPAPGQQSGGTNTGNSGTLSPTNTGEGASTSTTGKRTIQWKTIIIIIIILAFLGGFALMRGKSRREVTGESPISKIEALSSRLDERDRSILDALRERPMTAVELQQATGIPKTPLYRRLKKLLEEGLIEYYEENGVRVYKLKTNQ